MNKKEKKKRFRDYVSFIENKIKETEFLPDKMKSGYRNYIDVTDKKVAHIKLLKSFLNNMLVITTDEFCKFYSGYDLPSKSDLDIRGNLYGDSLNNRLNKLYSNPIFVSILRETAIDDLFTD